MDPSIFQSAVPNKSKTTFTLPPRVKTSQLQRRPPNKGKLKIGLYIERVRENRKKVMHREI